MTGVGSVVGAYKTTMMQVRPLSQIFCIQQRPIQHLGSRPPPAQCCSVPHKKSRCAPGGTLIYFNTLMSHHLYYHVLTLDIEKTASSSINYPNNRSEGAHNNIRKLRNIPRVSSLTAKERTLPHHFAESGLLHTPDFEPNINAATEPFLLFNRGELPRRNNFNTTEVQTARLPDFRGT